MEDRIVVVDLKDEGLGYLDFEASKPLPGRIHVVVTPNIKFWQDCLLQRAAEDSLCSLKTTKLLEEDQIKGYYAHMCQEDFYPCIPRKSLVIIPSPETLLPNPRDLRELMRALRAGLDAKKSFALILSESPFILQDVPSKFITMDTEDGPRRPHFETYGEAIDNIDRYLFNSHPVHTNTIPQLAALEDQDLEAAFDLGLPLVLNAYIMAERSRKSK